MSILGIDYGEANIGIAIASGPLAEPLQNLKKTKKIFNEIKQICGRLRVEKLVVGITEGKMAEPVQHFAKQLGKYVQIPVVFQDETLTTLSVIQKLKESGAKRKKLRGPKHAFSAAIILQEYLDQQTKTFVEKMV